MSPLRLGLKPVGERAALALVLFVVEAAHVVVLGSSSAMIFGVASFEQSLTRISSLS